MSLLEETDHAIMKTGYLNTQRHRAYGSYMTVQQVIPRHETFDNEVMEQAMSSMTIREVKMERDMNRYKE